MVIPPIGGQRTGKIHHRIERATFRRLSSLFQKLTQTPTFFSFSKSKQCQVYRADSLGQISVWQIDLRQPIKSTGKKVTSSFFSSRSPSACHAEILPSWTTSYQDTWKQTLTKMNTTQKVLNEVDRRPLVRRSPALPVLDPTEQNQSTHRIVPSDHHGSTGVRCRRRANSHSSCTKTNYAAVSRSHSDQERLRGSDTDRSQSNNHVHHSPSQRILSLRHHASIERQHRSFHTSVGLDHQYTAAYVQRSFRCHSHVSHSTADAQRQSAVLRLLAGQRSQRCLDQP